MVKGRAATQGLRLKEWYDKNLMKFNQDRQYLGQTNSVQGTALQRRAWGKPR